MRLPAEMRRHAEWIARGVMIIALAVLLIRSLRPTGELRTGDQASTTDLRAALVRWSTVTAPRSVTVTLDSFPAPAEREWLGAISRSGTVVTWAGPRLSPLAVALAPLPDPRGGSAIWAAAPAGATIRLSDGAGLLDSARSGTGYVSWTDVPLTGAARVSYAGGSAAAPPRDSLLLRRVLVLAAAGWESKFVVNALQERGWRVDALLRVAPTVNVVQGDPTAPDTARYAAVILLLDGAFASMANQIARYVRSGGGLVLAGSAPANVQLAQLRAGAAGALVQPDAPIAATDSAGRPPLPTRAILPRDDAVVLERAGSRVVLAARRIGRGRVLQIGYEESWRWRMTGADDPVARHREWWARAVRAVAYAPQLPAAAADARAARMDAAPYSSLVATLGRSARAPASAAVRRGTRSETSSALLFALLSAALVAEIASRRLRGAA